MTPAIDLLKKQKISHQIHEYSHNPSAASYGLEAAEKLGVAPQAMFKTLIAELNTGELVAALVPVDTTLNLKSLAKAAGAKKAAMAEASKVERTTGYVLGGVSPLGQKKRLRTFIHDSAQGLDLLYVSAGKRGLEIALAPQDLARTINANFAALAD